MSHHVVTDSDSKRPGISALTVRNEDGPPRAKSEVRFSRGPRGTGGLVVQVRGDTNRGYVAGEDLTALSVLLSEIPADEFVQPAPALDNSWVEGDVVLSRYPDSDSTYTLLRGKDRWTIHGRGANHSWSGDDADVEKRLSGKHWSHAVYSTVRRAGRFV